MQITFNFVLLVAVIISGILIGINMYCEYKKVKLNYHINRIDKELSILSERVDNLYYQKDK